MAQGLRSLSALARRWPDDANAHSLAHFLAAQPPARAAAHARPIALQCVADATFLAVMAEQARQLAVRDGRVIDLVVVRSVSGAIGCGLLASLKRSAPVAWLRMRQWRNVLAPLKPTVAYHSRSWAHPVGDLLDLVRAWRAWRRACRTGGDFMLEIAGIEFGDLIVDSCLRFRPTSRFQVERWFVWPLVWQTYRDVRRAGAYFNARRPVAYLTSYATYIEHGVAVRMALRAGVPVRAFGNLQRFGLPLKREHPFHTTDTRDYSRGFAALEFPGPALALAEQGLGQRLAGGVDAATSYMRASAYKGSDAAPADVRGAVVVFLHDFYDSPHVYADLVFHDFWAWVTFTIEVLQAAGIPFYLKPHPNQISLSEGVLADLKRACPQARFLSARVSNVQLAQQGMLCGVTVYGTVAHELAYLSVPSIACARHPHHSFGFCRTARTVHQYRDLLADAASRPMSAAEMKRQALAFYYMHNLHGDPESRALGDAFVEYWKASTRSEPGGAWRAALEQLVTLTGFAEAGSA